jgi:septal ring factor EnvC (AmiA/AmiB activator)
MKKITYIFFIVAMILGGCSDQNLKQRVQQLEEKNETLQQKIKELTQLNEQFNNAASLYQGCVSINGFLSQLCPSQVLIEGKVAEEKGYPGGGWQFWLAFAGKTIIFVIFFSVAFFLAWWLFLKIIEPKLSNIEYANEKIKNADKEAAKSYAEMREAEAKKDQIQDDLNKAVKELSALRQKIDILDQELARKKQDLDLLSGFE